MALRAKSAARRAQTGRANEVAGGTEQRAMGTGRRTGAPASRGPGEKENLGGPTEQARRGGAREGLLARPWALGHEGAGREGVANTRMGFDREGRSSQARPGGEI